MKLSKPKKLSTILNFYLQKMKSSQAEVGTRCQNLHTISRIVFGMPLLLVLGYTKGQFADLCLKGRLEAVERKISSKADFSSLASNVANLLLSITNASNDTLVLNGLDNEFNESTNGTSQNYNRMAALESSISSMQTFNRGLTDKMDSLKNQFVQSKNDLSNEINFLAVSGLQGRTKFNVGRV